MRLQSFWIWMVSAAAFWPCAETRGAPQIAGDAGAIRAAPESSATFSLAAVAADHPIASEAGAEILRKGGNAVDAAVAVSFTLSVVRPESCGIGGGGFMIIRFKADPRYGTMSTALNYREMCPKGIDRDYYTRQENLAPDASTHGGKAVAVPGTVAGLMYALEKYGTLDRATVMAPAIRAAREGYAADEHAVASMRSVRKWFVKDAATRTRRFAFTWERLCRSGELQVGDRIRLEEQARALEMISDRGSGAFYFGAIGEAVVSSVRADGGAMTAADLAGYSVREVEPLSVEFDGRNVLCMPPPSSGGLALAETFGILERLPRPISQLPPGQGATIHLIAEAMKHAFADRSRWLGDPEFVDIPINRLMSDDYLRDRAASIDPERTIAMEKYGLASLTGPEQPRDGGTSHFSVIDAHGNAVACTETINLEYGSLLCAGEFGFALNNQMDDFLTRQGQANAFGLTQSARNLPEPGKRPLSSMSPTIAVDARSGDVELVLGASGGPRIISATLQTALNAMSFGMSAKDATGSPRFHTQWMPDTLWLEEGLRGGEIPAELERRGHRVEGKAPEAACQVLRVRDGKIQAACDPRKGGRPAGY